MADDSLGNQRLSKHLPLVRPLQALLHNTPLRPRARAAHHPTLVVKVAQDHEQATVLGAEHVLRRDFDVVEGDKTSAGGGRVGGLDRLGLDTFTTGDEEDCEAAFGLAANCEVTGESVVLDGDKGRKWAEDSLGEGGVGDPFLGAVDDPVGSIGGLLGCAPETGNITASKGLADSQADELQYQVG